jgi:hypothetical protein
MEEGYCGGGDVVEHVVRCWLLVVGCLWSFAQGALADNQADRQPRNYEPPTTPR